MACRAIRAAGLNTDSAGRAGDSIPMNGRDAGIIQTN